MFKIQASTARSIRLFRPTATRERLEEVINEPTTEVSTWSDAFRLAAQADGSEILTGHLDKLGVTAEPGLLLEGTIAFVAACAAFAALDGRPLRPFLDLQKYEPSRAAGATYEVTFSVFGTAFARLITAGPLEGLDLADLYGTPWERYKCVGYDSFWVTRVDNAELTSDELNLLEQEVTYDLRFDYAEDELDFWFDAETHEGALLVTLQDHVEIDE